jgi:hypothetical protein
LDFRVSCEIFDKDSKYYSKEISNVVMNYTRQNKRQIEDIVLDTKFIEKSMHRETDNKKRKQHIHRIQVIKKRKKDQ